MSSSATAQAATADVIALEPQAPRNSDKFNMLGLPRISQSEHMTRALESGYPHFYIAERAGRMAFLGEDGIGFINAEEMHVAIMTMPGYEPFADDILAAQRTGYSFQAGVEKLKQRHPQRHEAMEALMPDAFRVTPYRPFALL